MTLPTFMLAEPGPDPVERTVALEASEVRHARSLRVSRDDEVHLVDGAGGRWRARVAAVGPDELRCEVLAAAPAPPPLPVILAFGVAARDRTLWLVEKAVELGALALQPVEFRRSRSVADAGRSAGFWRKAARRAEAALKQCGAARLPAVEPVRDLHDVLRRDRRPTVDGAPVRGGPDVLLARAAGEGLGSVLADGWDGRRPLRLLLGPEGGLEDEEREACRTAGFRPASLGERVLRFETAAVASLAVAGDHLRSLTDDDREDRDG